MNQPAARIVVLAILLGSATLRAGRVQVLLPDGSPAAEATAASVAKAVFLHIRNGAVIKHYGEALPVLGEDGRIDVSDREFGRWVFLHPAGWADLDCVADTREVRLQPWNEIRGSIAESLRAKEPATAGFSRIEARGLGPKDQGAVYWTGEVAAADDGSFVIGNLPSGTGVLGLMREFKNDRRVQRWKDFPIVVEVPRKEPVQIARTGVEVRGKLARNIAVPAMVTITDRAERMPPHFGVTDGVGVFAVPGIPAGDYRIVVRPLDTGDGKFHIQREFSVRDGEPLADLGELDDYSPDVEVYRQVEYPAGLVERVREVAAKQCARPIKKIWLGQLAHPVNVWGARVTFEPEPTDKTHAITRTFVVQIPGETVRTFYPEHDSEGYGYKFVEGEFFKPRMFEENVRMFPLSKQTLYLEIKDPLDYETVHALLKAIDEGAWKHKQTGSNSRRTNSDGSVTVSWGGGRGFGGEVSRDDLPKIDSIRREKPDGPIEVHTRDRDFGGKAAEFEQKNGEFILLGVGHWVS